VQTTSTKPLDNTTSFKETNGWSAAAISRSSRCLSCSPDLAMTMKQRSRRQRPSSKRPEQPPPSPTIPAPSFYTPSRDLTAAPTPQKTVPCFTPWMMAVGRAQRHLSADARITGHALAGRTGVGDPPFAPVAPLERRLAVARARTDSREPAVVRSSMVEGSTQSARFERRIPPPTACRSARRPGGCAPPRIR
jgi:hypothetical protein